jgi:hypothetical protein
MTIFIRYNPGRGSNWNRLRGGSLWTFDGETAIVKCPVCGLAQSLAGFMISGTGAVRQEFECAVQERGRPHFRDTIALEGWMEDFQRTGAKRTDEAERALEARERTEEFVYRPQELILPRTDESERQDPLPQRDPG